MGHVTYTSKPQRLTTKKVLSADNCSHLHLSFFGFERTFYQKLATQQQVSERITPHLQ
jgi:hypothetical protein